MVGWMIGYGVPLFAKTKWYSTGHRILGVTLGVVRWMSLINHSKLGAWRWCLPQKNLHICQELPRNEIHKNYEVIWMYPVQTSGTTMVRFHCKRDMTFLMNHDIFGFEVEVPWFLCVAPPWSTPGLLSIAATIVPKGHRRSSVGPQGGTGHTSAVEVMNHNDLFKHCIHRLHGFVVLRGYPKQQNQKERDQISSQNCFGFQKHSKFEHRRSSCKESG